jgi:phosphoribosylamine-glycine ligase
VLAVVGRGPNRGVAGAQAESAADAIRFDGLQRRHDIGGAEVLATAGSGGTTR